MINVQTIWGTSLTNTIGPSQTLKRMIRYKKVFEKNNIKYSVVSLDAKIEIAAINKSSIFKKTQSFAIFRFLVRNTLLFAFLSIYYKEVRHSISVFRKWRFNPYSKPDIVVFHDPFTFWICRKYAQKLKVKIILFHHGGNPDDNMLFDYYPILKKRPWVKRRIIQFNLKCLSLPDAIVFINPESYQNYCNLYKSINIKFNLIVNGIEDVSFGNSNRNKNSNKNKYKLVTVGTVNDRKNQILLLKALSIASPQLKYNIKITIVGDGPLLKKLIDYSSYNNLDHFVEFVGNQKDITSFLSNADIFILASKKEGLPISLLEALSFKLPIISSNISGSRECVIEGENGILFKSGDKKALAEIYCSLDKYNWGEFGETSRKLFESKFQFNQMQESYIDLLNELYIH
jgi:glycosyltransferase involved in cell wall biosynthesis